MSERIVSVCEFGGAVFVAAAVLVAGLAASAADAADGAVPLPDRPPNIVLILADDLGYGDLSGYGATDVHTPRMDRLIERGVRMDRFYANSTVCSPTRAALLTGRYPERVGVPGVIRAHHPANNWGYLDPDAVLLPRILAEAGYHCGLIGKWHLGDEPENRPDARGFHVFHGWIGDMMDDYWDHRRAGINYMRRDGEAIDTQGTHATELFTDWAIDYARDRAGSDRPFFLFLSHFAPHFPIQPPDESLRRVLDREGEIDGRRARNVALIEHMDGEIGRFLDALDELGVAESTLIILTSDNGGALRVGASNGELRGGKGEMYEGGIRVPFAAVWPDHIEPGSRSDTIAMTMDLAPTLARIAGARIEHAVDGADITASLLGGETQELDRDLFWVRREGGAYLGLTIRAMRRGDWKLVKNHHDSPLELFNLADDPAESRDLAAEHPERVERMSAALREQVRRSGHVHWQRPQD